MGADDRRDGDRHPVSMRIKLKYPDIQSFIERYSSNISRGGIFVQTRRPRPVGTLLRFEFLLADQTRLIRGEGRVAWVRERDEAGEPAGMGVKYTRLDRQSRELIERALYYREQLAAAVGYSGQEDPSWANASSPPAEEPASYDGAAQADAPGPADNLFESDGDPAVDGSASEGEAPFDGDKTLAPDPFAAPYLGAPAGYVSSGGFPPPKRGQVPDPAADFDERTVVGVDPRAMLDAEQSPADVVAAAHTPDADIDLELEAAFAGITAGSEGTGDVGVLLRADEGPGDDLSFTAPPLTAALPEADQDGRTVAGDVFTPPDEGPSDAIPVAADDLIEDFEIPAAEEDVRAAGAGADADADEIEAAIEEDLDGEETTTTAPSRPSPPVAWLDPAAEPSVEVPVRDASWHGPGEALDASTEPDESDEEAQWKAARAAAERRAAEEEVERAPDQGARAAAEERRLDEAARSREESRTAAAQRDDSARLDSVEEERKLSAAIDEEARLAVEATAAGMAARAAAVAAAVAAPPVEPDVTRLAGEGTGSRRTREGSRSRGRASASEVRGAPARPTEVRVTREEEEERRARALEEQFALEEEERRAREAAVRAARDEEWRAKLEAERRDREASAGRTEREDEMRHAAREEERRLAREAAKRAAQEEAALRTKDEARRAAAAQDVERTLPARPLSIDRSATAYSAEQLAAFDREIQGLIEGLDDDRLADATARARALVGDRPAETLAAWLAELSAPLPEAPRMTPAEAYEYLRASRGAGAA